VKRDATIRPTLAEKGLDARRVLNLLLQADDLGGAEVLAQDARQHLETDGRLFGLQKLL
jgi:hypothetical protein